MRALGIIVAVPLIGLGLATSSARAAPAAAMPYHATLSATEEKPPGPAGGTGTAKVTINGTELCYDLTWSKEVVSPNAAHSHKGPKGTDGPILVVLSPTTTHTCTSVAGPIAQGIAADPNGYYLNIHDGAHPG
ncbi:MAG: CHRD domain-containing protein, partial [Candidatus Dormibacteria bacterium]